MKAASYGRIVFGASAVLFGVIGLMWHDADTWQAGPILKLPLAAFVTDILALAQIAGGVGMLFAASRWAPIVLGAVYAVLSIACVPSMIAHPAVYGSYVLFFEIFSIVCGAAAAYAAAAGGGSIALARAARTGIGICTVSFALAQVFYLKFTASLVPSWIVPNQMFWAIFTTVAFALAAVAILINVRARLALRLMTLMVALFGLLVWVPALVAQPKSHGNWSEFALNYLIAGASALVAELKFF